MLGGGTFGGSTFGGGVFAGGALGGDVLLVTRLVGSISESDDSTSGVMAAETERLAWVFGFSTRLGLRWAMFRRGGLSDILGGLSASFSALSKTSC
jgi:hypothetical protein